MLARSLAPSQTQNHYLESQSLGQSPAVVSSSKLPSTGMYTCISERHPACRIAKINTSQMQAPSKTLNLVLAINKHLKVGKELHSLATEHMLREIAHFFCEQLRVRVRESKQIQMSDPKENPTTEESTSGDPLQLDEHALAAIIEGVTNKLKKGEFSGTSVSLVSYLSLPPSSLTGCDL